ncbi:MAG: nuclear transport factor 2 family protein [bacterium]
MTDAATYAEIAATVRTYVEGMCENDAAKLKAAMHERMSCIGHFDGGLEWDDRASFIASVAAVVEVPDPAPWYQINAISVMGDVAMVQVEDIWLDMHFDDSLTLLKQDGRWVIVAKVFYLRPA